MYKDRVRQNLTTKELSAELGHQEMIRRHHEKHIPTSSGGLIKMQLLIQQGLGGTWGPALLTSP